jgi:predicted RNA-binding protein YlqC (UPF0109 family)
MNTTSLTIATCPWLTKDATAEKAERLIAACLTEKLNWSAACEAAGIGYSRGWLIVRWAELMLGAPDLMVQFTPSANKEESVWQLGQIVKPLVDAKCSWGEVMVRTGQSEGACRKAFKLATGINDRGHRIGKGGRFVADRPDLYQENRKHEGAWIPATTEEHPAPSQVAIEALRNYIPAEKPVAKVRAKKAAQ